MNRRAAHRYIPPLTLLLLAPAAAVASSSVSLGVGGVLPVGGVSHLEGMPTLRELIPTPLPFRVDFERRFHPRLSAAAHLELGWNAGCLMGSTCASRMWGAGVSGRFHPIAVPQIADPWISAGVGYSRLDVWEPSGVSSSWEGPQLLTLSAGVDLARGSRLGVTPYLSAAWGLYLASAASEGRVVKRAGVSWPSIHGLFGAGLRVTWSDVPRGSAAGLAAELQPQHRAAALFDEAHALHEGSRKLAKLGRVGLLRQRLEEVIRLCDAALATLERDADVRPSYFTEAAGDLSRAELGARLRELRGEAAAGLGTPAPEAPAPPPATP